MHISYEKLAVTEKNLVHWFEFQQPYFTSPFHLHDEYELIVILKSHGKLYVGSNVSNFNVGDLFFFPPGLPHCFYNSGIEKETKELAHAVVIHFKKDFLGEGFLEKNETSSLKKLFSKSKDGLQIQHPSKGLIHKILDLPNKKNLEKVILLLSILNEVCLKKNISLLHSGSPIVVTGLNDSKIINAVYRYVAENFQNEVNFSKAASVANMQKSAFCRFFKRKTKKRFSDFVNETRIVHAQKLLSETDKTTAEIAYECGFNNTSYFNRQFKKYQSLTPMEFRKQINLL